MSCYTTKNMTISAFKTITVDSHHRIIFLNDLSYDSLKMFMEIRCPSEMTHFFIMLQFANQSSHHGVNPGFIVRMV